MLFVHSGVTYPKIGDPTSFASKDRYQRNAKRDHSTFQHSALELLRANRQIYNEAYKLFYHENDLTFSDATHLQSFIFSLGVERLNCLRSVILFCEPDANRDDASVMSATLASLRLVRSLQKLQILLLGCTEKSDTTILTQPSLLPGLKMLFTFRGLVDIRIRNLMAEDVLNDREPGDKDHAKDETAVYRHLNYGLKLAQKGIVNPELFSDDKEWDLAETWPSLEGSDCKLEIGCSCG